MNFENFLKFVMISLFLLGVIIGIVSVFIFFPFKTAMMFFGFILIAVGVSMLIFQKLNEDH